MHSTFYNKITKWKKNDNKEYLRVELFWTHDELKWHSVHIPPQRLNVDEKKSNFSFSALMTSGVSLTSPWIAQEKIEWAL